MRSPYSLYHRKNAAKKGRVYYVKFWNERLGKYVGHRSTGQASKAAASAFAAGVMAQSATPGRKVPLLGAYLETFWAEKGDYVENEKLFGSPLSKGYLDLSKGVIKNHALPYLEDSGLAALPLTSVTPGHIEALMRYLSEAGNSANVVNSTRKAIGKAFAEAERLELIDTNPFRKVRKIPNAPPARELFTDEELARFFEVAKNAERVYWVCELARTTGMRVGEIAGLEIGDIFDHHIHVCHNWQKREGVKKPKCRIVHDVYLLSTVRAGLLSLYEKNPHKNNWIFYGKHDRSPLDIAYIEEWFNETCVAIGIPTEERRRRLLTFHAWRHWYTTKLRGKIPDHIIDMMTGHVASKREGVFGGRMIDRYTSPQLEMMLGYGPAIEAALKVGREA